MFHKYATSFTYFLSQMRHFEKKKNLKYIRSVVYLEKTSKNLIKYGNCFKAGSGGLKSQNQNVFLIKARCEKIIGKPRVRLSFSRLTIPTAKIVLVSKVFFVIDASTRSFANRHFFSDSLSLSHCESCDSFCFLFCSPAVLMPKIKPRAR